MESSFDVVVVGAGSAGCVAAAELVRAGATVAVLEAGPDYGPQEDGRWPADLLAGDSQPRSHDWGFEEQRADGTTVPEPRARVFGGCSSHNECGAVWGLPSDYDSWVDRGCTGWSWADLAPLVDRIENAEPALPHRGRRGPLRTFATLNLQSSGLQTDFYRAARDIGFAPIADVGQPDSSEGIAPFYLNMMGGTRQNAAFAFLDPVRSDPRLHLFDDTHVDRLILRAGSARKVLASRHGENIQLSGHEYLLCAGTYGSPAVLMRSGIGPSAELRRLGITCEIDLPKVGANLHDHPGVALKLEAASIRSGTAAGATAHPVALRAKSAPAAAVCDLHLLPYERRDRTTGERQAMLLLFCLAPRSRGSVRLRSSDPDVRPIIRFEFFSDPQDRHRLIEGFSLARAIAVRILGSAAPEIFDHKHGLLDASGQLRSDLVTGYGHPVGTCAMGAREDDMAVVDPSGQVRGSANLRVADASIMPVIPRANTNLTAMLIGMKVAAAVTG